MEQFDIVPSSVYNKRWRYPVSCHAGTSKVSTSAKSHVPNLFAQEGNKQRAVCQSRHFGRKIFVFPSYQALEFADFKMDGVETGVLLSDSAQRKNADVPDIYFN